MQKVSIIHAVVVVDVVAANSSSLQHGRRGMSARKLRILAAGKIFFIL